MLCLSYRLVKIALKFYNMEKNAQVYRFSDPTTISSSVKKQIFIFPRNFIFGENVTSFVMGPLIQ